MKKNFLTGLVLLLPVTLTFVILTFIINLLTNPFIGITESFISHYHLFHSHDLFFSETHFFFSRFFILIFLTLVIVLTGLLAKIFLLKYFFTFGEYLIRQIPLVNSIYKTFKDVIHIFIGNNRTSFSQVALIPFPHEKAHCLGLITSEKFPEGSDSFVQNKVSLFLPGSPNPTMGFMLIYNKSDVVLLDMATEEALKFLVSCGSLPANFKIKEV